MGQQTRHVINDVVGVRHVMSVEVIGARHVEGTCDVVQLSEE